MTFDEAAAAFQEHLLASLAEQLERLHWDERTLAEHRRVALADTLVFAAERSRWHAPRLAPVDLDAVTPEDLTALPTMTKADLMRAWDDTVADPRLSLSAARAHLASLDATGPSFLLDAYLLFTTGGSTGEPGVFPWSSEEFGRWAASNIRFGADLGDPPPERLTFVGARSPRHPSALPPLLLYGADAGARMVVPIDQPLPAIADALNEIQPDSLFCVGSMLPALVEAQERGVLRIEPRSMSVGSDAVDPRALDAAERAFGVRPTDSYPTTDVGHIAVQPRGERGMVVADDLMIVEAVDEHDRAVAVGEVSHHLLVTSLHQRTVPLIRYRIDDRVRFDVERSERYPAYSRIAEIDGRADDLFRYGRLTVHPHTFRSVLSRHHAVRDYQVRQTPAGAEVLVVQTGPVEPDALASELRGALATAGLPGAVVTVRAVEALPRTALGKRRLFVSG
jgi:phenylacetate-coenzyme A ligase PaaK-like adenylate-forming protein